MGREAELGALEQAWEETWKDGVPRAALIGGEPGIGKSRIAAQLAEHAHRAGAGVLYGRSDPELAVPVQPFAEAFGELAAEIDEQRLDQLGEAATVLARIVPPIRERLELSGERPALDEPAERHELFHAAVSFLQAITRDRPLLLIVDDLHWADRPTALMLRYLLSSPDPPLAMTVATYRTTEVEPDSTVGSTLAKLERLPGVVGLELEGLPREGSISLAAALAGDELGPHAEQVGELVHTETAGNPLFATQLFRNLADAGALDRTLGREELRRRIDAVELPGSVTEALRGRVDRLGPEAVEILSAGAVIGPDFDLAVVEGVAERDTEEVCAALDAAAAAGLIDPGEGGGTFGFTHPLIGRVLYEGIGPATRGTLHRRAALRLEELLGERAGARAGELARHWLEASPEDPERARRWSRIAGQTALEQFEAESAARWYGRALELHGEARDELRCDLLTGLGVAQRMSGEASFRETLLEAARLASELDDADRLSAAALANNRGFASASGAVDEERIAILELALERLPDDDSVERARLLATLAAELSFSGEWERRVELSDTALAMARRLGDLRALTQVLTARFVPIWMPETLTERLANSEENVRVADQVGRPLEQFGAVHWSSVALIQAARIDEAVEAVEREARLAAQLGDPTALWIATYDRGNLALLFGRLDEAEALANEAFQIATESGQPDALSFFGSQIANVRYEQGRLAELQELLAQVVAENPGIPAFRSLLALAYVEGRMFEEARQLLALEAESRFEEIPRDVTWLAGHAIYAHVCAALEEPEVAAALYERIEPFADQIIYTGISVWSDGDHALGRLAATQGELQTAERHLQASRSRAREIGAATWAVRSSLDLARLLLKRGSPDDGREAIELLDGVAADARRLGIEQLQTDAENLRAHAHAQHVIGDAGGPVGRLKLRRSPARRPEEPTADEGAAARDGSGREAVMRSEGDAWEVSYPGGTLRLRDVKGVRYLAQLLERPGVELHAVDLQSGPDGPSTVTGAMSELSVRAAGDEDAGAVLDEQAKRAYRQRIDDLREEIEEAESFNDPERASRAREELDYLGRELAAAVGLGGRDRKAASSAERARVNVTRAIRKTVQRINELDSELGEHLDRSINTGAFCSYQPAETESLDWRVEGPSA